MSDRVSAMAGETFSGSVEVAEAGLVGMVAIRGDLGDGDFAEGVAKALGVPVPGKRQVTGEGGLSLLWMSPDELLLVCAHDEADDKVRSLSEALGDQHHLAVNVSDARAVFRLEGEGAAIREVLAKLTPADVRPGSLPTGEVRRTRMAQVPAAFWFEAEGRASVVCFRSVAAYVFGLLSNVAASGSEVGYF